MLTIRKTGEGYYLASIAGKSEGLNRGMCHMIKKELTEIIKPHREITLDLRGVKSIESGGVAIMKELKNFSDNKKCKLRFINAGPEVSKIVTALNTSKVIQEDEIIIG